MLNKLDKQVCLDSFDASGIVCRKPCWLYSISLSHLLPLNSLVVGGNPSLAIKGNYYIADYVNNYPYYLRVGGVGSIWLYAVSGTWFISLTPFNTTDGWYYGTTNIYNGYVAAGGVGGTPTVVVGSFAYNINIYDGFDNSGICRLFLVALWCDRYELHYKYPVFYSEGMYLYLSVVGLNCLLTYKAA